MSFDDHAKNWDKDNQKIERAQILAQKISEFSREKKLKTALEFGCGTGLVSFFLRDDFDKITLADTSPGMIEVLKEKIESEKVSHFDPVLLQSNEQLPDSEFDVIYSLMVMHHVADLDSAIMNFKRSLKKSGYLFIADLVKEDGDFHKGTGMQLEHHGFEKEELVKRLEKFGFELLDYRIFYTMEKMVEPGVIKQFPVFLLIAQKG